MSDVKITLKMTEREAFNFAQLVKRVARKNLGRDGLDVVTPEEETDAEAVLYRLRDALSAAGYEPR